MVDVNYFISCKRIEIFRMDHGTLKSTPSGLNHIANSVVELHFRYNSITSMTSMKRVKFVKLRKLHLYSNSITHLHPEAFIAPRLQSLNLVHNALLSMTDVTQRTWGSSLRSYDYLSITLFGNPWHCNESLTWMQGRLFRLKNEVIYAKPPLKPCVRFVQRTRCNTPYERHGTTVVPRSMLQSDAINIRSLNSLIGEWSHLINRITQ